MDKIIEFQGVGSFIKNNTPVYLTANKEYRKKNDGGVITNWRALKKYSNLMNS